MKLTSGATPPGIAAVALAAAAAYVATIVAANWALESYGFVPMLWWTVPAGVYFAGLAFGLRDVVHELTGPWAVLALIAVGTIVSWSISDGATIPGGLVPIAAASGIAFAVSELADLVVYTPLRERHWGVAVAVSNACGAVFDTTLFLWLAFGSAEGFVGTTVGKILMILPALPLVWIARRAVSRHYAI